METNLSRRSIAKGAAWAVPAVTVASAAPAMAASPAPSVRGNSWFYSRGISPGRVDGLVQSGASATCGYTVSAGPASVTNLSITYWLPPANYVFAAAVSNGWSLLKRDTSKANLTGSRAGATYYAYTTTYAGTGDATTTCGPAYEFQSTSTVSGNSDTPNDGYYYQFSYALNGTATTNQLQALKNP